MKIIIFFGDHSPDEKKRINNFLEGREKQWGFLSIGKALRKDIKDKKSSEKMAKPYSKQRKLVLSTIVVNIIKNKLQEIEKKHLEGFIIEGFPQSISEAEKMKLLQITPSKIIYFYDYIHENLQIAAVKDELLNIFYDVEYEEMPYNLVDQELFNHIILD